MATSRRTFLKATAAAVGIGLVGLRRKSARALVGTARARRVLVLNASGGLRTTAAFAASTRLELNPWGVLGTSGVIRLGRVLVADPGAVTHAAPSWPGSPTVPGIAEAARSFALIGAVDHAPGQPRAGDHPDDSERMGTGYFGKEGAPGLLTALARYVGRGAPAPTACVGGGPFDRAQGDWIRDAPTALVPYSLPSEPPTGGSPTVGRPIEDALDARLVARRRGLALAKVEGYLATKTALRVYGPLLADRTLHLASVAQLGESFGGITNRMLLEAVGSGVGDTAVGDLTAVGIALGLRLLQRGAPAIVCGVGGFDLHSDEEAEAPTLYTRFARYLAGIHFALGRIPDETGMPLLDSTLVVTTSEFGRSPGTMAGFNDARGTDHGDGASWRYQAHVLFGAGLTPRVLAPVTDENLPTDGVGHSTHALLATICAAVGVPQAEIDALWPPGTALYPEGAPLLELWS
jgi:hypothetical protein